MIAHLQNGEYHGNRILKAETAEMMHNSPLTILPPLNRMELGFFETNVNEVTQSAFDPISREPNFKQCAVTVERTPIRDRRSSRAGN